MKSFSYHIFVSKLKAIPIPFGHLSPAKGAADHMVCTKISASNVTTTVKENEVKECAVLQATLDYSSRQPWPPEPDSIHRESAGSQVGEKCWRMAAGPNRQKETRWTGELGGSTAVVCDAI